MTNLINRQIAYEFRSTHHLVDHVKEDLIESGLESLAQQYVDTLTGIVKSNNYLYQTKDGLKEWTTKKERHAKLMQMDLLELAWKVIATCTVTEVQTYTSCVGQLKGLFKNDTVRQDIEQASECVAVLNQMNLIDVILPRDAEEGVLMVRSRISYDGDLSDYLTNTKHIMPSLVKPKEITCNKDSGYRTFESSLILGGKYHKHHVPYDHINRANSVALSINPKALEIEPEFKNKDDEDAETRRKRYEAWKQLNVESVKAYAELIKDGNRFHLTHKYDERLRTYSHGHQVNTQGDSYRKSVIELADKEVVQMQ